MAASGSVIPRRVAASTTLADGQRVAERNGEERLGDGAPLLLLHPQRHREEPSHSGVESVVGAEEQHQPQRRRSEAAVRHFASE